MHIGEAHALFGETIGEPRRQAKPGYSALVY
jgi:hypothetical protein